MAGAVVEGDGKVGDVYVADDRGEDFYPSPSSVGPLTVTDVEGTTIVLVSESGDSVRFDYSTRSFDEQ